MPDTRRQAKLQVHDHSYGTKLLTNLNKQRLGNHSKCDLKILDKQGQLFWAHKAIVAAASPYFDAMLSSNFIESTEARVALPFSQSTLSTIMDFIYTGRIFVSNDIVLELLYAADFLFMDYLKGPIVNFICADVKHTFSEQNINAIGIDAAMAVFNVLKYFVEDDDVISNISDLLMTVEEKNFGYETFDDELPDPLINSPKHFSTAEIERLPSGTNVYRIFSNKLYRFDGFGWTRVICPEFNEKAPSLKSFAVVDENGKFLTHNQDELCVFEMEEDYSGPRSPGDRSLKPFLEETISIESNRLCFSENTILALFTKFEDDEENLYIWNELSQDFQPFGDIWPLKVTYLDYIFEDSVQGKSRLFIVGNFKTLADESIANSVFSFNLCPISGSLLSYKSVPVLPFINNSYIYHHFGGKLIAIPRIIGRNFCKDFYRFDERTFTWSVWEEAKLKVEDRTILDVVSTKEYLYLIMSSFDHRWQNEFVQWNGHEFTDVTFSTSIPIEGKLLERISWIDYNVIDKVLKKARRLWL